MLRFAAYSIDPSPNLTELYQSLTTSNYPREWKLARIVPVPKWLLKGVKGQSYLNNCLSQHAIPHTYINLSRTDLIYIIYDTYSLYWHSHDNAHYCIQPISKRLVMLLIDALPEHLDLCDIQDSLTVAS